jgi:hypothetical protein
VELDGDSLAVLPLMPAAGKVVEKVDDEHSKRVSEVAAR